MSDTYLTIDTSAEATYTEKRSKFIAFALPVATPEDALEIIGQFSRKYYDARHVCWAYMVGPDRTTFRSNDNGEPSGTAGKPILGQINSFGLTDILIVVVRYFGGVKLGTPGLIAAYRASARAAIENATIVEKRIQATVSVTFPYQSINDVMRLTKEDGIQITETIFDNTCRLTLVTGRDQALSLIGRLEKIDGVCVL